MDEIALLFPGQGSQCVGMGKSLLAFPEAKHVFDEANRIIPGITKMCFEGPEETLRLTMNAQPAIFTVSMACYQVFKKNLAANLGTVHGGTVPKFAVGHSVGEYGAITAAGALSFEEGLRLVQKRGEIMYQAGLSRPGTMAAILGLSREQIEQICREVSSDAIVEVANLNSPIQSVISGDPKAVESAMKLAKERGAKRVVPLNVSGAFHSELMKDAALKLSSELDKVHFKNGEFPIVSNVTGQPVSDGETLRARLKDQIRKKVRWEESIRFILNSGAVTFIEMEPGNVLSGLVRSIDKSAKILKLEEACNV